MLDVKQVLGDNTKIVTQTAVHNPPSSQNDFRHTDGGQVGGQAGGAGFRQKADQPLAELVRRSCFPNEGGAPNR